MRPRPGEHFRPAVPPYAAIDNSLGGAVVLVLGHWLDARGREVAAEVATMAQRRRLLDLRPIPPAPAFQPFEDESR
jgi:hypothetical protein